MGGGQLVPGYKPRPYRHLISKHDDSTSGSKDALTKEIVDDDKCSDLSAFTLQESMRDLINNSRFSMSQYSVDDDSREEERSWKREESSPDSEQGKTDTPPAPVGFWNSGLKSARKTVCLEWVRMSESGALRRWKCPLTPRQH